MKYFITTFALILGLTLVSCTEKEKELEPKPATAVVPPEPTPAQLMMQQIPKWTADIADKTCQKDSDCTHIQTQCSCDCGDSVNKRHLQKYNDQFKKSCDKYAGIVCKNNCKGQPKCVEQKCVYAGIKK